MKRVAIMQPYFLPYIGYFQLINAVDEFIIYDNIQFSKKGWFHRNRLLQNGKDEYFTLPLKKDSDFLDVNERFLSDSWEFEKDKILRKIKENYRKAPFFEVSFPIIEEVFNFKNTNLFEFSFNSLKLLCNRLDIKTSLIISSTLDIEHDSLRGEAKVIALCKVAGATHYVNPIGGLELYNSTNFENDNLELSFIKSKPIVYEQFNESFVPWLSILDLMMFNSIDQIKLWLNDFDVIRN